ncbi:unnamed protein product [Rhodiola kirilowii]
MAPNPRIIKAISAMKALGVSEDVVKPVLKNLFKVFEKNWEPIEEENYRALADAVFEYQETNAVKQKRKPNNSNEEEYEAHLDDETERPLKRTRRPQTGQGTSSQSNYGTSVGGSSLQTTISESGRAPENSFLEYPDNKGTSSLTATSPGNEHHSVRPARVTGHVEHQSSSLTPLAEREKTIASHPVIENGAQMYANAMKAIQANPDSSPYLKEKRKKTVCEVSPKERIPIRERPSQAICLKEPKVEPGITSSPKIDMSKALALIQPKEEPFVDCSTNFAQSTIPSPRAHPNSPRMIDSSNGDCSAHNNGGLRTTASPSIDVGNNKNGYPNDSEKRTVPGHEESPKVSYFDLESASSPVGEVRISLSCTLPRQSDFRMPGIDTVLRLAEEKCVKIYSINTNFSVKQVIRDVCDSFLELGSKSKETVVPNPLHNPPCTEDLRNAKCNHVSSESVPSQSAKTVNCEIAVPEAQRAPPCTGAVNDHKHPADNLLVNTGEETDRGMELNGNDNDSVQNMEMVVADGFVSIYLPDLTGGEEGVEISLVNEINSICLSSFKYMPHSMVYENACLDISLARIGDGDCCKGCIGDCLTANSTCACVSRVGGSFAYTLDGLLKEEFLEEFDCVYRDHQKQLQFCSKNCPLVRSGSDEIPLTCNGHVARKFIKECWRKCGCNKMCGNRLIQRGITRNLQVFMTSDGKGWGLRTLEDLPKGAFVCEYVGEILTLKELHSRYTHNFNSMAHPVLLDAIWGTEKTLKDERTVCLDGTDYGNIARFINHRCSDSNLIDIPVEVESPDHHYYHIALFTRRKINALEELTWDYGIDFEKNCNPVKAFQCLCGSKYCRDIKMR